MNINDLVKTNTWRSNAEKAILERITTLVPLSSFEEHDQFIIEGLIRKSLVIKVHGKTDPNTIYVYPNV